MKNVNKVMILAFASALALISCSKKEDPNIVKNINSGSITATLTGLSTSGLQLNESLNFTNLLFAEPFSCTADTGTATTYSKTGKPVNTPVTKFTIHRYTSDMLSEIKFSFKIDNSIELYDITEATFSLDYSKKLTDGSYLQYYISNYNVKTDLSTLQIIPSNFTITNITYNKTSGLLTADYYLKVYTVNTNNMSQNAEIKGSISVTVYSSVN